MRRRLVEVQPEVELACASRACARAYREGGGIVRRGGEEGCSGGSSTEPMDILQQKIFFWTA